jgi:hypothetical protein
MNEIFPGTVAFGVETTTKMFSITLVAPKIAAYTPILLFSVSHSLTVTVPTNVSLQPLSHIVAWNSKFCFVKVVIGRPFPSVTDIVTYAEGVVAAAFPTPLIIQGDALAWSENSKKIAPETIEAIARSLILKLDQLLQVVDGIIDPPVGEVRFICVGFAIILEYPRVDLYDLSRLEDDSRTAFASGAESGLSIRTTVIPACGADRVIWSNFSV